MATTIEMQPEEDLSITEEEMNTMLSNHEGDSDIHMESQEYDILMNDIENIENSTPTSQEEETRLAGKKRPSSSEHEEVAMKKKKEEPAPVDNIEQVEDELEERLEQYIEEKETEVSTGGEVQEPEEAEETVVQDGIEDQTISHEAEEVANTEEYLTTAEAARKLDEEIENDDDIVTSVEETEETDAVAIPEEDLLPHESSALSVSHKLTEEEGEASIDSWMHLLFSRGYLDMSDYSSMLRVSKEWNLLCTSSALLRSLFLSSWPAAPHWKDEFDPSQVKWREHLQWSRLLAKRRKISRERIECVYDLIAKLSNERQERSTGDTLHYDRILGLLNSVERDVSQEKLQKALEDVPQETRLDRVAWADLYYLVNNTFVELKLRGEKVNAVLSLITKDGQLITVSDTGDHLKPQEEEEYSVYIEGEEEKKILTIRGEQVEINREELESLSSRMGTESLSAEDMMSYLWNHCLAIHSSSLSSSVRATDIQPLWEISQ
ncbi:hypothetical protein PROFUN_14482 [Planoprotostelium fungivorum]|uniref:Uncharacterized protein n=1 Tax=Planoprotostelium fungivorum TaxID=1890364 RepID=A0A2P6N008_9EUKA|nr:hypothetical protein PROFUN_14482 [Planoprotostelium fungivorum]